MAKFFAGVHWFRSWLDLLLQCVLPVAERRVCHFSLPDYTDNAYYFYRHLLQTRSGLDHLWLVADLSVTARMHREFEQLTGAAGTTGNTLRVKLRRSLGGYLLHLTSRYLCYTERIYTASARYRGRRLAICLWHGMPIKDIRRVGRDGSRWNRTDGDLHIASSHFFKYIIASSFDAPPQAVLVCRLPRCDALYSTDARALTPSQVRERLGIPPERKLILWLPTFRTEPGEQHRGFHSFLDDLPAWALPRLNQSCRQHQAEVMLKLHKCDALNGRAEVAVGNIHLLRSAEWERQEIQLYDLLAASDALISDVSSVLIDCIPTGKRLGILGFDAATYVRGLAFPFRHLLDSRRFDQLNDAAAIEGFVRDVAFGVSPDWPANDCSRLLHETFLEAGAEAVAAGAGL